MQHTLFNYWSNYYQLQAMVIILKQFYLTCCKRTTLTDGHHVDKEISGLERSEIGIVASFDRRSVIKYKDVKEIEKQ